MHARGFGDAGGGRRVTAQTPFVLGSTAKSFTALAAMQLVDAGRLQLDAPARRYVPEFRLADAAGRRAHHGPAGPSADHRAPAERGRAGREERGRRHRARGARGSSPTPVPAAAPGTAFEYSNGNFILAGLIIERASGQPYGEYVQRHVFAPLGMRNSYVALDAAQRAGLATGHRYWFGFTREHGPTFRAGIQSAGYLISSAADMGRYLAMYLDDGVTSSGRRIVSRAGLQTMLAPGRPGRLGAWADHADARYAMGWYVGGPWSEPAQLHPGRAPDSSALMVMFPRRDLAVVTLTNAANQLAVPGYPASVDRVERNAVDALIGDPIESGTSLHRFYLLFDLIALALLVAAVLGRSGAPRVRFGTARARGGAPPPSPASRYGRILGLALLALPAVTLGWQASWLWQPDLSTLVVLIGGLLLVTAALRLGTLLRRVAGTTQEGPATGTTPTEAAPSSTPVHAMTTTGHRGRSTHA